MAAIGTLANTRAACQHVHYKRSEDPNAPVVMLFGWAACQDKYLAKYSQMYEDKSWSVARFTVPVSKVRSVHNYRDFALGVYQKVLDNDDKGPLFFHVFSMNGCSLFVALWDLLSTLSNGADIKARTKGIVFDSCPADVFPSQLANAISCSALPSPKYSWLTRICCRLLLTGFFSLHDVIIWLRSFIDPNAFETNYAYIRMLKMMDLPKRQLYLFSKADTICSDHSIEEFQKVQQERGVSVTSKCWPDSAHVQHLRAHPAEYAQHCVDFISDILIQWVPRHNA